MTLKSGDTSETSIGDMASLTQSKVSSKHSDRGTGSNTRRQSGLGGNFIKGGASETELRNSGEASPGRSRLGSWAEWLANSSYFANVMACVIMADAVCTWVEVDSRAAGSDPSVGVIIFRDLSLVLYSFELVVIFLARGFCSSLKDWIVGLDVLVVLCGYLEIVLEVLGPQLNVASVLNVMRALRLARIFRLLRVFRRIRALRELQKLVHMMATCLRTLAWSLILCFVIMTMWAMLLVEVVHPMIQEMSDVFDDCEFCQSSLQSVMSANLLLFKTVIAGDSWGRVAVPVIQQHPWTALIFVGSLLTLVFGVLNIIIAVVVDTFAEARQNDIMNLAEEMEQDLEKNKEELTELFIRLDKDGSGQLSLEELMTGARRDPVLQSRLRVMDIDENDLEQLFLMIDVDRSGTIEAAEFIGPLSRWVHDSKTAPRFIKYNLLQTMQLQEDLYNLSQQCFHDLSQRIERVAETVDAVREKVPSWPTTSLSLDPASQSPTAWATGGEGGFSIAPELVVEQPAICTAPNMMTTHMPSRQTTTGSAAMTSDHKDVPTRSDSEMTGLLDGLVAKVERGMLEMENRLKRVVASAPADAPMPAARRVSHRSTRGDLFRAVYGETKLREKYRKVLTCNITNLALPERAASAPKVGEGSGAGYSVSSA